MSDWEKTKCILCGKNAERHVFKDPLGDKYKCDECPLYAVAGFWNDWIKRFATEDEKKALTNYLKLHPDKQGFKEIDSDFIIKALKNMPESIMLKRAEYSKQKGFK